MALVVSYLNILQETIKINNEIFKIEIWDTAGQERYKSITSAYYKGARGAIVVYDITSEDSFKNIDVWIEEVKSKATSNLQIMLIGNKSDLFKDRKISKEQGIDKARSLNLFLFEASALDKTNVNEAFKRLLSEIYLNIKNKSRNNGSFDGDNFGKNGMNINMNKKQTKKCC